MTLARLTVPLLSLLVLMACTQSGRTETTQTPPAPTSTTTLAAGDTAATSAAVAPTPTDSATSPSATLETAIAEAPSTPASPAPTPGVVELPDDPLGLMDAALYLSFRGDPSAVQKMGDSGNVAYIPVLVEYLRFPWLLSQEASINTFSALSNLIQHTSDPEAQVQLDWDWWMEWLGRHREIVPPDGYAGWKGRFLTDAQSRSMGRRIAYSEESDLGSDSVGDFLYDGIKTRIRLEEIVWGGVPKDGIPDLTNPPVLNADEATYLHPADRVFGVSFNGEHRAYPLRILNAHEMANDVVGGVPFALAY